MAGAIVLETILVRDTAGNRAPKKAMSTGASFVGKPAPSSPPIPKGRPVNRRDLAGDKSKDAPKTLNRKIHRRQNMELNVAIINKPLHFLLHPLLRRAREGRKKKRNRGLLKLLFDLRQLSGARELCLNRGGRDTLRVEASSIIVNHLHKGGLIPFRPHASTGEFHREGESNSQLVGKHPEVIFS